MKSKRISVIAWLPALSWMGCIFYLSHQPAEASSSLSGGIMKWLLSYVPAWVSANPDILHTMIRKGAHFGAYFILGLLVLLAIKHWQVSPVVHIRLYGITLGICFLYAASDEFHQLFIPGRSGEIRDVLLDSSGALVGLIVHEVIHRLIWHKNGRVSGSE